MVYRNKEGYADPTAGAAIHEAEPKAKKKGIQPGSDNPCIIGKIGRIKKSDRIGHNKENGGLRYGRI